MSDDNRISLHVDLGVDLLKMYRMIFDIHQELVVHRSRQATLEERVQQLIQKVHDLEHVEKEMLAERSQLAERLLAVEEERTLLLEYVEHNIWDTEILWLEEWLLGAETQIRCVFCSQEEACNTNRIAIVSRCGSWNNLMELWEYFARSCEQENRVAHEEEIQAITAALRIFNASQRSRNAALFTPEEGAQVRSHLHRNLSDRGSVISRVAFPGILNVQEDVKGKALVYTE